MEEEGLITSSHSAIDRTAANLLCGARGLLERSKLLAQVNEADEK